MAASALLLGASLAALDLCTGEYLLLLARPQEIASVSYLSHVPQDSALWRLARRHPANRGSIEDVLKHRPGIVLTMGGGGRASALIARRVGIRTIELQPPSSPADVADNLARVASALGEPARARPWIARLRALETRRPRRSLDTIWLSGGGRSQAPQSPGAQWMALAGLRQRALPADRATLETLLTRPPAVLLQSNYRVANVSVGTRWLDHPIVRNTKAKRLTADGRAWTCLGPLMIPEIERLRKEAG